ncbi:MAG: hypothetical protein ACREBS_07995 [Nitrososphaerales archaeon]
MINIEQTEADDDIDEESSSLSGTCIAPKEVVRAKRQSVAKMFGSHDWVVDDGKMYGTEGVLIHYHCSRCAAEGFSTIISRADDEKNNSDYS